MKIGIQGIRGSYHDKVAKCYFGDSVSVQEFLSFDDLAISVSNNDSDFGITVSYTHLTLPTKA